MNLHCIDGHQASQHAIEERNNIIESVKAFRHQLQNIKIIEIRPEDYGLTPKFDAFVESCKPYWDFIGRYPTPVQWLRDRQHDLIECGRCPCPDCSFGYHKYLLRDGEEAEEITETCHTCNGKGYVI